MLDSSDYDGIKKFYQVNGYVHISGISSKKYLQTIKESFNYYNSFLTRKSTSSKKKKIFFHFRNKEGLPRHIIDVIKDRNSPIRKLINEPKIKSSYELLCDSKRKYFVTHSKISFKTPYKETFWMPHQDSGYKVIGKIKGFAIFVCLEDMNELNGALQVFPGSHKLGLLPHIRKIENKVTYDGQYYIERIPKDFLPKIISAKKGDIIIFHNDCIHQSGNCNTDSKRFAFICEVSCYERGAVDGYGNVPYLLYGKLNLFELINSFLKTFISGMNYWHYLRVNHPRVSKYVLRFILKPLKII